MTRVLLFFALLAIPGGSLFAQMHIAGNFSIAGPAKVAVAGAVLSDADVTGGGALLLNDTALQTLDCSGHTVSVLEVANPAGVLLAGGLGIGDSLIFTDGRIRMDDYDVVFAAGAGHAGAAAGRYLVTDGAGVVTAADVPMHAPVVFPVGQSDSSGDYTPAAVTNHAAVRDISVRVKDYGSSQAIAFDTAAGVNRVWEISAGTAGDADIALTHIAAAEGTAFDNNAAFVTQQLSADGTRWSIGTPAAGSSLTHTGTFTIPVAGDSTAYFSKSSNTDSSLGRYIPPPPPPDTPEYAGNLSSGVLTAVVTPNPFAQHTYLQLTAGSSGTSAWWLTDLAGRTLAAGRLELTPGVNRWLLPVQELVPGTYLLHLSAGKGQERQLKLTKW